jgi:hypothetical protein
MVNGNFNSEYTISVGRRAPIRYMWNSEEETWESGY